MSDNGLDWIEAMSEERDKDQPCEQCDHNAGLHSLIATNGEVTGGGIMLCPEKGCRCFSTWDVPPFSTFEDVVVPTEEEIDILRQALQNPL